MVWGEYQDAKEGEVGEGGGGIPTPVEGDSKLDGGLWLGREKGMSRREKELR